MQKDRLEYYGEAGQEAMACGEHDAVRLSIHQPTLFRGAALPPRHAQSLGRCEKISL
jgi:hypothetical protein